MSEQLPHNIEANELGELSEPQEPTVAELEASPTALVRRSDGEVSIVHIPEGSAKNDKGQTEVYILKVDPETGEKYIYGTKAVSEKGLSDEVQAALAADYEAAHPTVEQAEREVSPVVEKLGDVGLDAFGIENPSHVNENAVSFKNGEINALREAAREKAAMESNPPIITGVPNFDKPVPVIPGLEQMMAEQPPVIPDLAAKMSGEAAPEAPKSYETQLIELTESLSQDDRLELRSYADAKIAKREAQKSGDGEQSTLQGQYMGQALKNMTPAARQIKDTYASLYERA